MCELCATARFHPSSKGLVLLCFGFVSLQLNLLELQLLVELAALALQNLVEAASEVFGLLPHDVPRIFVLDLVAFANVLRQGLLIGREVRVATWRVLA